jgi:tetratricopeptide (TPR) repeat protein
MRTCDRRRGDRPHQRGSGQIELHERVVRLWQRQGAWSAPSISAGAETTNGHCLAAESLSMPREVYAGLAMRCRTHSSAVYASHINYLPALRPIRRCFRITWRRSILNRLELPASMYRACALAFIFTASFAAHAQQTGPSITSIESLIRSKQYGEALQTIKSGLHEKPSDFRLWTLKGIVLSIQNEPADALTAFDEALRYSPGYPAALRGKVEILYQSEDERAIPLLAEIVKNDPNDKTAHEMLALLDRKHGDCTAAIDQFRLSAGVIETHPGSLAAYGDCLINKQQPQDAVPVFTELSALLPQNNDAQYDLAVALVESKQNEAAIKVLEPLLAARPSDPELLSLASDAYEGMGDTPKAVSLLHRAIVIDPTNANYYVAFAALCLAHSSFQVGIDMIDAGLQSIKGEPSLYISRGLLYAQLAKYDLAESDFNTADKLDSAQSLSSYGMDLVAIAKNDNDQALQHVREQLKTHPESPWLQYALAWSLANKPSGADGKSAQEAIQAASQAVKLKPDLLEARNLLANLYIRSDQYDAAVEQSRAVLQHDPSNESAMFHLIVALRRSGKSGATAELQDLSKRLSDLQQASSRKEIELNRYKLVEQQSAPPN